MLLLISLLPAQLSLANPSISATTDDKALQLGKTFRLMVGEVDEALRDCLGRSAANRRSRPADLAGIKAKSIIKEIDYQRDTEFDRFWKCPQSSLAH